MSQHVYVIDDDAVAAEFVSGISRSAGFDSTSFADAESFLRSADRALRGCVVLDLRLEGMDGLQLQLELHRRDIFVPVIIVSGHAEVSSAVIAMKQQAFDFFEKPVDPHHLLAAIQRALTQDNEQALRRGEAAAIKECFKTLSPRERQVMELVVSGLANKQIAGKLCLSEKTIEVHRGNVMRKMRVESLAALVKAAMLCGAGSPPATPD